MAIDQTDIAVNSCASIVSAVNKLFAALDELEAISEQLVGAGITLSDFDDFIGAGAGIKHCNGNVYDEAVSVFAPNIVSSLKAYYGGSPTKQAWASLQKIRKTA